MIPYIRLGSIEADQETQLGPARWRKSGAPDSAFIKAGFWMFTPPSCAALAMARRTEAPKARCISPPLCNRNYLFHSEMRRNKGARLVRRGRTTKAIYPSALRYATFGDRNNWSRSRLN
jgi:hypothetical protein